MPRVPESPWLSASLPAHTGTQQTRAPGRGALPPATFQGLSALFWGSPETWLERIAGGKLGRATQPHGGLRSTLVAAWTGPHVMCLPSSFHVSHALVARPPVTRAGGLDFFLGTSEFTDHRGKQAQAAGEESAHTGC